MIIHCENCMTEFDSRKGACPSCGQPIPDSQKAEDRKELLKTVAMITTVSVMVIVFLVFKLI